MTPSLKMYQLLCVQFRQALPVHAPPYTQMIFTGIFQFQMQRTQKLLHDKTCHF